MLLADIFLFEDFKTYLFALITVLGQKKRAAYQHSVISSHGKSKEINYKKRIDMREGERELR